MLIHSISHQETKRVLHNNCNFSMYFHFVLCISIQSEKGIIIIYCNILLKHIWFMVSTPVRLLQINKQGKRGTTTQWFCMIQYNAHLAIMEKWIMYYHFYMVFSLWPQARHQSAINIPSLGRCAHCSGEFFPSLWFYIFLKYQFSGRLNKVA